MKTIDEIENPELRVAFEEAADKVCREHLFGGGYAKANSKDTIADTMEEIQRLRGGAKRELDRSMKKHEKLMEKHQEYMKQAELTKQQARGMTNPVMREITVNLKRKQGSDGLICPVCGEGDHRNKINGKPYCFMNAKHKGLGPIPLMTPEKAKDWEPPKKKSKFKELWELDDDDIVKARGNKKRHK